MRSEKIHPGGHDALRLQMRLEPKTVVPARYSEVRRRVRAPAASQEFGADRVMKAARRAGIAAPRSAGALRLRPVPEIQFSDFIFPAFDQIVTSGQVPYRSGGQSRARSHRRRSARIPAVKSLAVARGAVHPQAGVSRSGASNPYAKGAAPGRPAENDDLSWSPSVSPREQGRGAGSDYTVEGQAGGTRPASSAIVAYAAWCRCRGAATKAAAAAARYER